MDLKKFLIILSVFFLSVACGKQEDISLSNEGNSEEQICVGGVSSESLTIVTNSETDTKLQYGNLSGNVYPLYWTAGDKVKVCKYGNDNAEIEYSVTPETGAQQRGSVSATTTGLTWTAGQRSDIFSSVFPSDAQTKSDNAAKTVTIKFPTTQAASSTLDMSNFRMLGFQKIDKTADKVYLNLKPVTTAFKITVQGPQNNNFIAVSGVSVTITNNKTISSTGEVSFKYNEDGTVSILENPDAPTTISFNANVTDGNNFWDINKGQSRDVWVLVPGINLNSSNCKIRVRYGGFTKAVNLKKTFTEAVRYDVKTHTAPDSGDNEWITILPDDMKVKDMSIPGSFICLSYMYGAPASQPMVQEKDIPAQCALGIRTFHQSCTYYQYQSDNLGTGKITASAQGYAAAQPVGNNINVDLFDKLIDYLKKFPGEFIIVINNYHDPKSGSNYNTFKSVYDKALKRVIANANYKNYFYTGSFNENTTIKDLRGKILLIHQSDDASFGPVLATWPLRDAASAVNYIKVGNINTPICVADEWQNFGVYDNLIAGIEANIKRADDGEFAITELVQHSPDRTRDGYVNEFKFIMPKILNKLRYYNKTGILLLGYVGVRYPSAISSSSGEYTYGDILPQLVIDKNFK